MVLSDREERSPRVVNPEDVIISLQALTDTGSAFSGSAAPLS